MSLEKRRAIASKGGKAAQASPKAHKFTREENVRGGRKGGATVSKDAEHMSAIGRIGGASTRKAS